jgi:hypothetical protein
LTLTSLGQLAVRLGSLGFQVQVIGSQVNQLINIICGSGCERTLCPSRQSVRR